jgi:MFS family permease
MSVITASTRYQTRSILIGAAVLLSLGMGLRQSLGLFLPPVTRDLALTAADFTLAIAVQNVVWGVSQAAVGALADRFGLRVTMMTGALIYVAGLGVLATATGQLSLIVSGAMVGVALSCTASSLVMTAVARSVPEARRSKTLGMVSAAGSLGTLMVPITTQSILASNAWQWGALFFVILAASMLPAGFYAGRADRMPGRSGGKTTMRAMPRVVVIAVGGEDQPAAPCA